MNFFFGRVGLVFTLDYPRALISPSGPYPSHQLHPRQKALSWQEKQSVKLYLFFFFKILFYQLLFNRVLLREKNCSSTNFSSTKSSSTKSFQQTSFEQIQSLSLTNSGLPRGILLNIIDPQRTTLPQTFLFNTHLFFSFSLSQI